mmetsp:Transcript_64565/g.166671  ORF Transcript_64565/g.166671 Transcript_64565/m.166671 type:complete len:291 (-) Transcript_64565:281-1153(-)
MMTITQQPERFGYATGFSTSFAFVNLCSLSDSVSRSETEGEVRVFGAEQKSNAQMIADLLAKLPMPQQPQQQLQQPGPSAPPAMIPPPQPLLPQMTGYFRPPPGLELALGFENAAMSKPSLDSLSTMDDLESLSEVSPHSDVMAPVSEAKMHRPGMTTVMVRNIPVMYTQDMLVSEWKDAGVFDFLYLPRSGDGHTNLTYAFINFVFEQDALAFKEFWHKKRLAELVARKPLNTSFADVQGLNGNLMQLKKKRTRCMEARQCHPLIIKNGCQLTLEQAWETFGKVSRRSC